jgi:hypothetical protein
MLQRVREQAQLRHALRFQLVQLDGGYNGGPIRLFAGAGESDNIGGVIVLYGQFTEQDGYSILNNLDPNDPYFYEHQDGGWAAVYEGQDVAYFPYLWHNDMLGGTPDDAVVCMCAAGMPNGTTFNSPTNLMHMDETSHANDVILTRLAAMIP